MPSYTFLVDFIKSYDEEKIGKKFANSALWELIQERHDFKGETLGLETLWLLLTVRETFPKALNKAFMIENFGRKKLVTEELVSAFVKAKDELSTPIHLLRKHPVFDLFITVLKEEEEDGGLLKSLWFDHVDPTLAKESSTAYKTLTAFFLLEVIMAKVDKAEQAAAFLTSNVVETAFKILAKLEGSSEDDQHIFQLLAKFVNLAKENESVQEAMLTRLLTFPGNIAFDKLTGGNTVHQLVSFSSAKAVKSVGDLYRRVILGVPDGGQARTSSERIYSAHQLARLVAHPALQVRN